ncbi:dienelactone hydrolase family protein [Bacteroidota bacterium]
MKNLSNEVLKLFLIIALFLTFTSCNKKQALIPEQPDYFTIGNVDNRKAYLDTLLQVLPPDYVGRGRGSFLDLNFQDWLSRTGELPPDFKLMPSIPFLPNPLILDEGGANIPVTTMEQWVSKREWMKKQLQHIITGTFPPKPENLKAKILSEEKGESVILQMVELSFGPEHRAKLTFELMIPNGDGPFPVFMTQWTHREWALIAVRRGYIGCVYAGADSKDDTESYSEIWSPDYDFSRLMRRAFGAYRAIDYLHTLPFVDKDKIGLTGLSRNGKQTLFAAAFDERITAAIPISGGTGAEVPWRYCTHEYDTEDIALLCCNRPSWFHPRLRFFLGRENKLPVDQNSLMALIAPRGLMLTSAINEQDCNPWGIEQAYHVTRPVYEFLNAEDQIAIYLRHNSRHGIGPKHVETYIDFFDFVFGRTNEKPENKLIFNYSFEKWKKLSGESIDPLNYQQKDINDLLLNSDGNTITSLSEWKTKKNDILKRIQWGLGEEPPGLVNKTEPHENWGWDYGHEIGQPRTTNNMGRMEFGPFGDMITGYLYYPVNSKGEMDLPAEKVPAMIYLHEYDYSKAFTTGGHDHEIRSYLNRFVEMGYVVLVYEMIGFGNRLEETSKFYNRYPHWSKMGKMVTDVMGAVDGLSRLEFVDSSKIVVTGYSLGATVGLYATALDKRIAGLVSVCGFTPMRLDSPDKGTEGIMAYSHLHDGLIPRLGFFVGKENRIPYDFHEILACIAPRPVLIISPAFDKETTLKDVKYCVEQVKKVYELHEVPDNILIYSPVDYNRFSKQMRERTYKWINSI